MAVLLASLWSCSVEATDAEPAWEDSGDAAHPSDSSGVVEEASHPGAWVDREPDRVADADAAMRRDEADGASEAVDTSDGAFVAIDDGATDEQTPASTTDAGDEPAQFLPDHAAPDVAAPEAGPVEAGPVDAGPPIGEAEAEAPCIVPSAFGPAGEDEPTAMRSDIAIRKVIDLGPSFVRLAVHPLTQVIHYLDISGDIYRLESGVGTLAYSGSETGAREDVQGMAFGPDGSLYVVANVLSATTFRAVIRVGVPGAGGARVWSTLASTPPIPQSNTAFDHHYNGIAVSPDGRFIFVNAGSRTDHGEVQDAAGGFPGAREVPLTSAILRIPANVSGLLLPEDEAALRAGGYLFADGLRNAFDPEFAPTGELFAGDNGPDADYPEELNVIREGAHYGFPWRLADVDNPQRAPSYDPALDRMLSPGFYAVEHGAYHNDPTFPAPPMGTILVDPIRNIGPHADIYRDPSDGAEHHGADLPNGIGTFSPHRVPIGLAFDRGMLCGDFARALFVLSFGAASTSTLSDLGRDLSMVHGVGPGRIATEQIARGFRAPIDDVLLGNRLYVLDYDDVASAIWEVTLPRKR